MSGIQFAVSQAVAQVALPGREGVVGHNNDGLAVAVGQLLQKLQHAVGVFLVRIAGGFVGGDGNSP